MKPLFLLTFLLLLYWEVQAQVQLSEIVFAPRFEPGTRYATIRDNEVDVYISDGLGTTGTPVTDFIPTNFNGMFIVSIQDYDSKDGETDAVKLLHKQMAAQDTEREFYIKISPSGKKLPLRVSFNCDWDCVGTVESAHSPVYLNKTIRQANRVSILLESASTSYARQQAVKTQKMLKHYGFLVGVRYVDPSRELYNYEYHWQGGNDVFVFANSNRENENNTLLIWRYLRRIFQFNHLGILGSLPLITSYPASYRDYDLVFILPYK